MYTASARDDLAGVARYIARESGSPDIAKDPTPVIPGRPAGSDPEPTNTGGAPGETLF